MSRPRHRVLVIADRSDDEATLVRDALEARGVRPAWLDTAEFPGRLGLAFTVGAGDDMSAAVVLADGSDVELCEVEAIDRRSPAVFELDDEMSGPERRFAMAEAVQGVGGAFAALGCRWMNSPSRVADASYKPLQLAIACAAGFAVPRTLVTTTWWFLEANPNGKWAWLQEETGQQIAESVARRLVPAGRGAA